MTKNDLRIGSIIKDLNEKDLTVIRFESIFTIATYGKGEVWLVDSHLKHYEIVKY